jgi:hypothetical protein
MPCNQACVPRCCTVGRAVASKVRHCLMKSVHSGLTATLFLSLRSSSELSVPFSVCARPSDRPSKGYSPRSRTCTVMPTAQVSTLKPSYVGLGCPMDCARCTPKSCGMGDAQPRHTTPAACAAVAVPRATYSSTFQPASWAWSGAAVSAVGGSFRRRGDASTLEQRRERAWVSLAVPKSITLSTGTSPGGDGRARQMLSAWALL